MHTSWHILSDRTFARSRALSWTTCCSSYELYQRSHSLPMTVPMILYCGFRHICSRWFIVIWFQDFLRVGKVCRLHFMEHHMLLFCSHFTSFVTFLWIENKLCLYIHFCVYIYAVFQKNWTFDTYINYSTNVDNFWYREYSQMLSDW